jgi:hypothetical protein
LCIQQRGKTWDFQVQDQLPVCLCRTGVLLICGESSQVRPELAAQRSGSAHAASSGPTALPSPRQAIIFSSTSSPLLRQDLAFARFGPDRFSSSISHFFPDLAPLCARDLAFF